MNCISNELLSLYIDNLLDSSEKLKVESHLDSCEACALNYKALKNVVLSVQNITINNIDVSDNFINAIFTKIDQIKHPSFEAISTYYDNENNLEKSLEIRTHLEECYPCEKIYNSINFESNEIAELPSYEIDEDLFLSSLMSKIEEIATEKHINSEDLSAYVDKEYQFINKIELEEHIKVCSACNENILKLERLKKSTQSLPEPILDLHFASKVLNKIEKKEEKIVHLFSRKFFSKISIAAAITAIMLVPFSRVLPTVTKIAENKIENITITEHSENYIFSSGMDYKSDSIEVLTENTQKDDLEIEDIGL
ncbi:MAG: zf-HC2 domain-containing protein [Candidatus Sericytochromatia bacterium]